MEAIADGVWRLEGRPAHAVNVYLVEDVLIDAATRWAARRILDQLRGRRLSLVALTHCHPDHQGTAALVCKKFGVPLACHVADVPVMEGRKPMQPRSNLVRLFGPVLAGPPWPVKRPFRDGDEVAGFRVVHTPGHTPGHVLFFRPSDRLVVAGDLLANINWLTRREGLREPPTAFSVDARQNRQSLRLLLSLQPSMVCFGHGPPLRDLTLLEQLVARVAKREALEGYY